MLTDFHRAAELLGLRFPTCVVAEVVIAVAEALRHAWTVRTHRRRPAHVLHGDWGPSKICMADHGTVQVDDFGGRCDEDLVFRGTPAYRDPEIRAGDASSPASDPFSLGVILWETLVGERFRGVPMPDDELEAMTKRPPAEEAARVAERSKPLAPVVEVLVRRELDARLGSALEAGPRLRGDRLAIDYSADFVRFVRPARSGRVDSEKRTESLQRMPWLPDLDLERRSFVKASGFGPQV